MRKAVSVVILKDGLILLVKKKETWILPGGKPEKDETDLECLFRELKEELPNIILKEPRLFHSVIGITPHKGDYLKNDVYISGFSGGIETSNKKDEPVKQAEFVKNPEKYKLSNITRKIIFFLRKNGYLI